MTIDESGAEAKQVDSFKALISKRTTRKVPLQLNSSGQDIDLLGAGGEAVVNRVSIPTKGGLLSFAFKEYASEGWAAHALKAWVRLKSLRLPVPPTFRLIEENGVYKGILMTDLTRGWQDILITSNATKGYVIDQVHTNNPSTVSAFANLNLKDDKLSKSLDEQLALVAEKTARNGIKFNAGDVVSAVYKHTGELDLVISDMGNVQLDVLQSYEELYDTNLRSARMVRTMIYSAQEIAQSFA